MKGVSHFYFLTILFLLSSYICYYNVYQNKTTVVIYRVSSYDEYEKYLPPMQCSIMHRDPCKDYTQWTLKTDNKNLHTNIEMSQFIFDISSAKGRSYIKIITHNNLNEGKRIGGDFWWMNVIGPSSFHVDLKDNADGTYESHFSFMEPGNYTVTVELIWSLCDGLRDPPSWWFKSGDEQGKYQKRGSLGMDTYIGHKKTFTFTILKNYVPHLDRTSRDMKVNSKCEPINSPCGYWKNNKNYITAERLGTTNRKRVHVQKNSTIWFYGDSMQLLTYRYFVNKTLCKVFNCGVTYNWNYPNPPSKGIFDNKDFNKTIILNSIQSVLMQNGLRKNSSVFFLNFGVHILMAISFEQAVDLLRDVVHLIQTLRIRYQDNFARIIWKTTTAPFRREFFNYGEDFRRFLTKQRMILWNSYSKDIMCEADIPIIDVYYVTASYMRGAKDGLHFADDVYKNAMSAFEEYVLGHE